MKSPLVDDVCMGPRRSKKLYVSLAIDRESIRREGLTTAVAIIIPSDDHSVLQIVNIKWTLPILESPLKPYPTGTMNIQMKSRSQRK